MDAPRARDRNTGRCPDSAENLQFFLFFSVYYLLKHGGFYFAFRVCDPCLCLEQWTAWSALSGKRVHAL